jgi:hypothetical protein
MAYLATDANVTAFNAAIGLAAFAGRSFTRRYGDGTFVVDAVTLGDVADFGLQQMVQERPRLTGFSERRTERPERKWIDYTLHRRELVGWVDATFSSQATLSLHAIPGSVTLGPGADVQQDGFAAVPPQSFRSTYLLGLNSDAFTLTYTLNAYLQFSSDLSPLDDLRNIQQVRDVLEADPSFLASLDGPADQRPFLFVQVYAQGAADGGPLAPAAVTALFDRADVLAVFFSPPA